MNILKDNSIRFTDIRFLNDKKEDKHIFDFLRDYIKDNAEKFPMISNELEYLIGNTDLDSDGNLREDRYRKLDIRKFIFCTSLDSDSLVMWNYYVNNKKYQGYNLGFRVGTLLKTFDTEVPKTADPFTVLYGKVLYEKKEKCKELEKILAEVELDCARGDYDFARVHLLTYIDSYGPFFKHDKFLHENEYRIVVEIQEKYLKDNGMESFFGRNNKKIEYGFTVKEGVMVPYLQVKFSTRALARIGVSPTTEFDIAKEGVRELLRIYNYKSVSVYPSSVPIRF